jgi:hypothetical protein
MVLRVHKRNDAIRSVEKRTIENAIEASGNPFFVERRFLVKPVISDVAQLAGTMFAYACKMTN